MTEVLPAASAGAIFHAGHDEREVPRDDAGADTERLEQHVVLRHRERRAGEVDAIGLLLGHPGEPVERAGAAGDVGELRLADGAAAVERFDLAQLARRWR